MNKVIYSIIGSENMTTETIEHIPTGIRFIKNDKHIIIMDIRGNEFRIPYAYFTGFCMVGIESYCEFIEPSTEKHINISILTKNK